MILLISMKESSFSRTVNSLFLILSLNVFFGSSLRELGISFHSLAPILEKVFFFISSFYLDTTYRPDPRQIIHK